MSLSKVLSDPVRIAQIKYHREKKKQCDLDPTASSRIRLQDWKPYEEHDYYSTRMRLELNQLDEITLIRMTYWDSHIYFHRFIELVIIEEPYFEYSLETRATGINFLVEDRNKHVIKLQVFGIPDNENTWEMFTVGRKLFLVEPFCRFNTSINLWRWLQVVETHTHAIVFVDKKKDMCRYCGKENATMKCATCKNPYCGRECQLADWKILKHKLVCSAKTLKRASTSESESKSKPNDQEKEKPKAELETAAVSMSTKHEGSLGQTDTVKEYRSKDDVPLSKPYLQDPVRIARILNIRLKFNFNMSLLPIFDPSFYFPDDTGIDLFIPPKLTKPLDLKPIYFKDMMYNRYYEGKFVEVTIIEEPLLGYAAIHFVVEDNNRDVSNMAVNGLPQSKSTCERLSFGTKLMIVNPVYKIGAMDGVPMLRIDDLKMIVYLGKIKDMCRYCGEENAKMRCGKCKRMYCGKECQLKDWRILKHELVCKIGAFP